MLKVNRSLIFKRNYEYCVSGPLKKCVSGSMTDLRKCMKPLSNSFMFIETSFSESEGADAELKASPSSQLINPLIMEQSQEVIDEEMENLDFFKPLSLTQLKADIIAYREKIKEMTTTTHKISSYCRKIGETVESMAKVNEKMISDLADMRRAARQRAKKRAQKRVNFNYKGKGSAITK